MIKNADITLYHKEYDPDTRGDQWGFTQYPEVSWYGGQAVSVGENGLNTADKYTVRIFTKDAVKAEAGDIVVKGMISIPITSASQLKAYEKFTVTSVQDNRRGSPGMHHWKLEVK